MDDIEHQAKDEDVTTIENNLSKGGKKKGLRRFAGGYGNS